MLKCKTCKEHLRSPALFSLEKGRGCTFLRGGGSGGEVPISSLWWQGQDMMKWSKMHQGKFSRDMRKVSAWEVVSPWKRLPREVVIHQASQSSRRVWTTLLLYGLFLSSFARSRELYSMILKGPFQLEVLCYSTILNQILQRPHIWNESWGLSLPLCRGLFSIIYSDCLCTASAAKEDKVSFNFRGKRPLVHGGRFSFKTDWALSVPGSLNTHKMNVCMHAKFPTENDHGLRDHVSHFLSYYLCSALKVNEC